MTSSLAIGLGLLLGYTSTTPKDLQKEYSRQGLRYGLQALVMYDWPTFSIDMGTGAQAFHLVSNDPSEAQDYPYLDLGSGVSHIGFSYKIQSLSLSFGPKWVVFHGSDTSFSTRSTFNGLNHFLALAIQYVPFEVTPSQKVSTVLEGLQNWSLEQVKIINYGVQVRWSHGFTDSTVDTAATTASANVPTNSVSEPTTPTAAQSSSPSQQAHNQVITPEQNTPDSVSLANTDSLSSTAFLDPSPVTSPGDAQQFLPSSPLSRWKVSPFRIGFRKNSKKLSKRDRSKLNRLSKTLKAYPNEWSSIKLLCYRKKQEQKDVCDARNTVLKETLTDLIGDRISFLEKTVRSNKSQVIFYVYLNQKNSILRKKLGSH